MHRVSGTDCFSDRCATDEVAATVTCPCRSYRPCRCLVCAVSGISATSPGAEAALGARVTYTAGETRGCDFAARGGSGRRPPLYSRHSTCFSSLVVFYHYASSRKLSRATWWEYCARLCLNSYLKDTIVLCCCSMMESFAAVYCNTSCSWVSRVATFVCRVVSEA